MATRVYLSTVGRPVEPEKATISVFDRGFLYGDSVYETMRTANGTPLEGGRHLARLRRSAAGIGLQVPWSDDELSSNLGLTHHTAGNPESYLRLIVTRGSGPLMLDPGKSEQPELVVICKELELPDEAVYCAGLSVMVVETAKTGGTMLDPSVKSGNYLNNILALRHAAARGCNDAILCSPDGMIAEGATSNLFMVEAGRLKTPALEVGLLPGITREVVCELARASGLPAEEARITPEQLRRAEEVFLTSSVRGIMPVTTVDGVTIGAGTEGAMTHRLRRAYQRYVAGWSGG